MGNSRSSHQPEKLKEEEAVKEEQEEEEEKQTAAESEDSSSDSEGEAELPETLKPQLQRQGSALQYAWEQKIVDDTLMRRSPIIKAAIFGLDGALKAWAPPDFTPDRQVIQDIMDGFEGDTSGLAERGLAMDCGANPAVPAKMEESAIFGNDGKGGGTSVFKTVENLIIIVFKKNPTIAHRLAMRTATFMRNYQR